MIETVPVADSTFAPQVTVMGERQGPQLKTHTVEVSLWAKPSISRVSELAHSLLTAS